MMRPYEFEGNRELTPRQQIQHRFFFPSHGKSDEQLFLSRKTSAPAITEEGPNYTFSQRPTSARRHRRWRRDWQDSEPLQRAGSLPRLRAAPPDC